MIEGVEGPFSSSIVAPSPGQGGGEGGSEEVDSPGDDHVVVVDDEHRIEQMSKTNTLEQWDAAEKGILLHPHNKSSLCIS